MRTQSESDEVSAAEFNRAFVAMQYYGHLRRTPEADGYQAWLNYLNANPTDYSGIHSHATSSRRAIPNLLLANAAAGRQPQVASE